MPDAAVPALLDLLVREPGRPRLTWYGPAGERVELSGAVLVNWVHKTTNLLVDELDAVPGTRVRVDLPAHWRAVLWALGTWRAGAALVLADAPADVLVVAEPAAEPAAGPAAGPDAGPAAGRDDAAGLPLAVGAPLVVVPLPALARRVAGPLPAGGIDGAAEVMGSPDALGWVAPAEPSSAALVVPAGPQVAHADLLAAADAALPGTARERVLLPTGGADRAALLLAVLAVLARDGSVVLVDPAAGAAAAPGPERDRLVATERVDRTAAVPGAPAV
ncbi:TIGR03089 family protein [Cellulomonas endophytica]|uniref:TIGR03089 family protein n=1 Tax=Cellulomonas endophytica TaxID=2494735 RepID=UPI00101038CC|nr:TIGR03089 family protein [Cellulomonas endophytica]